MPQESDQSGLRREIYHRNRSNAIGEAIASTFTNRRQKYTIQNLTPEYVNELVIDVRQFNPELLDGLTAEELLQYLMSQHIKNE